MFIPLIKSSVNENQTFRGKIGFLESKRETWGWEEKSSYHKPMYESMIYPIK
jgi:hypothetical protein